MVHRIVVKGTLLRGHCLECLGGSIREYLANI